MINDVRRILSKTHCTIHPTYYPEGLSNVLLESAACGRPIITTDRSGTREVVDGGTTGYLINEKDSADLIGTVEKFLKLSFQEKKQWGLAARKKVSNEFDRNIIVAYMKEIYSIVR